MKYTSHSKLYMADDSSNFIVFFISGSFNRNFSFQYSVWNCNFIWQMCVCVCSSVIRWNQRQKWGKFMVFTLTGVSHMVCLCISQQIMNNVIWMSVWQCVTNSKMELNPVAPQRTYIGIGAILMRLRLL